MKTKFLITLFAMGMIASYAFTQDLTFKFINPAFGGDTFNYQWLLSSADAQNTFKDETGQDIFDQYDEPGSLADFENSLNRQILSQLSRKLIDSQFGEGDLEEGTYIFGDYQVEIGEYDGGLNIIIIDLTNGDQSTVFIPYY